MQGCLPDKTGFKFYDREIISLASQKSGIHEEHFESVEKKPTNSILYSVVMGMYSSRGAYVKLDDVLTDDKIYKVQADIIRDMAAQGNCVFVGRCSDYILRNNEKCFNIFLRGNLDDRVKRVMSEQNTSEAEAKKIVSRAVKNAAVIIIIIPTVNGEISTIMILRSIFRQYPRRTRSMSL